MNVKEYRREGIFFVITGPSGAGKTTIMETVLGSDNRLSYSVSHTTREKRKGESEGEDYHFIEVDEFKKMKQEGEFVEWAEIYGDYYGTSKAEIDRIEGNGRDPFLDIDVQGAAQIRNNPEVKAVFLFVAPPSIEELRRRIENRGTENEETLNKRIRVARKELNRIREFDYLIVNEELDSAVADLRAIIRAERLKV
ncbi:guanylate kinase [Candidatus Bipolaricaulota bacterium]|nr:guanylate kinase [Candidatus Bipolaricaulota bacterium]